MTKPALLLAFFALAFSVFGASRATQTEQTHEKWLEERLVEATSIEEGMTRAELLKVFTIDGGLQRLLPRRYVLKSCTMIKVEVEFDVAEDANSKTIMPEDSRHESLSADKYEFIPNDQIKIKRVSQPYLERGYTD